MPDSPGASGEISDADFERPHLEFIAGVVREMNNEHGRKLAALAGEQEMSNKWADYVFTLAALHMIIIGVRTYIKPEFYGSAWRSRMRVIQAWLASEFKEGDKDADGNNAVCFACGKPSGDLLPPDFRTNRPENVEGPEDPLPAE